MSWDIIEAVKPSYVSKNILAPMGLFFSARRAGRPPHYTAYIALTIGAELAKKSAFVAETHRCHILIGSGGDTGSVKIQIDNQAGGFTAKRQKRGSYLISINEASAANLFALDFEKFAVPSAEVIRPENGQPVFFTFRPDPALFVDQD